jgi:hypothetical protein
MNYRKQIFLFIEKIRSSIKNNYCLFCRTEMDCGHYCEFLKIYLLLDEATKKEVVSYLDKDLFSKSEIVQQIKNKILAYSL